MLFRFQAVTDGRHAVLDAISARKWGFPLGVCDNPISTSYTINEGAYISFSPKEKTVHWSVSENNHAVECAGISPVTKALFMALSKVEWVRGTGGKIYYTNEYEREGILDGGSGGSVSHRYGPLGSVENEGVHRMRPATRKPKAKK